MSQIVVKLILPSGAAYNKTKLNSVRRSADVMAGMVSEIPLPRTDKEGREINYELRWLKGGTEELKLDHTKSLGEQGIRDGDTVRLLAEGIVATAPEEVTRPLRPGAQNVTVRINIVNMSNRTVREVFPYSTVIVNVLNLVHKKYKLHVENSVETDYRVVADSPHRRELDLRNTLEQENIGENALLDIIFKDMAG